MWIKIHKSCRTVVALCDSEILGKKFEEGKRELFLRENFYKGEEVDREKALSILLDQATEDATFNIAGKESVETALEAGIIKEEGVHKVKGIPFALVLL